MPRGVYARPSLNERFWQRVRYDGPLLSLYAGRCWPWSGALSDGYGVISGKDRQKLLAHRVVYELMVGPIPTGLQIDHLCRNRACVNPMHLETVTQRENLMRGEGAPAKNARRQYCVNGHPFAGVNLGITKGHRYCRACHKISQEKWRAKAAVPTG